MKKLFSSKLITLVLCLAVLLCMPLTAAAETTSETGSVTASFLHDITVPVRGAQFRIYRIGYSASGRYNLTERFSGYPVSLENLDDTDVLNGLATALGAYIARDSVTPDAEGKTDDQGNCTFSGLETGLYIVTGDMITVDNKVYTPKPFIVSIPFIGVKGETLYDVTAEVKYDSVDKDQADGTVDRTVHKVWKDSGYTDSRPITIDVQLLRNNIC